MKLSLIHKFTFVFALFLSVLQSAQAQVVVTQTQPLSFGTFSFLNYATVMSINIENNGSTTTNGNAAVITPATRGEYDLDAGIANANSIYTVTPPASVTITGPDGDFTIDNFRVLPAVLTTDAAGFDEFRIMARINSAGGGTQYTNGLYDQDFDIVIAF